MRKRKKERRNEREEMRNREKKRETERNREKCSGSVTGLMRDALRLQQNDVMPPFRAVLFEWLFPLCALNNSIGQMA